MSVSARISEFVNNNPMKVYSSIFIAGDLTMAFNVMTSASMLWLAGIGCGLVAHTIGGVYGRGARNLPQADDYKITLKAALNTVADMGKYAAGTFTKGFVRDAFNAAASFDREAMKAKLKNTVKFKQQPLDAQWAMVATAGAIYTVDAVNLLGFRDTASLPQAITGVAVASGASLAFVSDNNAVAGRLFALATFVAFIGGVIEKNIPIVLSCIPFLYGHYLVGKVDSRYQSDYTAAQAAALESCPDIK